MASDAEDFIFSDPKRYEGRRFDYGRRISEADMAAIQHNFDQLLELGIIDLDGEGAPVWTDAAADAFHKVTSQTWC